MTMRAERHTFPGMGWWCGLAALWLSCGAMTCATAQTNDLSGQTDASIRNVITLVAHHQIVPLADGDYAPVDSLAAATNALRPVGISWSYPWGVVLYGMLRVADATGDPDIERFVLDHNLIAARYYAWLKSLNTTLTNTSGLTTFYNSTDLSQFMKLGALDYCGSMTAQMLEGVLRHAGTATAGQVQVALTTSNYIAAGQSRLPDTTLWRSGTYGGTIWADDLYMSCPFLVRWSQYTNAPASLDDATTQIFNMAGYLQDTDGLWFHGFFYNQYGPFNHTHSPIKWGRANGWAMVATVEVLSAMPTNHPARAPLLDILRRQIAGVEAVQAPSGLWRQVLDHPELWEETSCSAMFAYSIARAVNRGWIDPTNMAIAHKAFVGLCRNVKTNGVVTGTCEGTNIGTNLTYYVDRTQPDDDLHGRGPVMLAGAEILSSETAPPPPALQLASSNTQAVLSWPAALTHYTLETATNLTSSSGSVDECPGARERRAGRDRSFPASPVLPVAFQPAVRSARAVSHQLRGRITLVHNQRRDSHPDHASGGQRRILRLAQLDRGGQRNRIHDPRRSGGHL